MSISKVLNFFLFLLLSVIAFTGISYAAVGDVWLVPVTTTVSPSTAFSLGVHANSGTQTISNLQFEITYDTAFFAALVDADVVAGADLDPAAVITPNTTTPGTATILVSYNGGIGSGTDIELLNINFTSLTNTGTTTIPLSVISFSDTSIPIPQPIGTPNGTGGTVTVGAAAAISLPKTGQTTSYAASGGDDGAIQAGVDWPSPRFTVAGDGTCLRDELTGLVWRQKANVSGYNWAAAVTFAADYLNPGGFCTFNDWRLPTVNELESLINYGAVDPVQWLIDQGFTLVQAGPYWASTTYFRYKPPLGTYLADVAWVVDISKKGALTGGFYQGLAAAGIPLKTVTTPYIWSVRGGIID